MIAEHHAFIWRSIVRLGVPRADAEDAAQQVFIVASRKLAAITDGAEKAFLFSTARRMAWRARRTLRRRREEDEPSDELPDPGEGPEAAMDRERARRALDRVLDRMPMELRAVFVLFELEQLTMVEIAALLDLAPGTVASRLRRGRLVFRAAVARMGACATSGREIG